MPSTEAAVAELAAVSVGSSALLAAVAASAAAGIVACEAASIPGAGSLVGLTGSASSDWAWSGTRVISTLGMEPVVPAQACGGFEAVSGPAGSVAAGSSCCEVVLSSNPEAASLTGDAARGLAGLPPSTDGVGLRPDGDAADRVTLPWRAEPGDARHE